MTDLIENNRLTREPAGDEEWERVIRWYVSVNSFAQAEQAIDKKISSMTKSSELMALLPPKK